MTRRHYGRPRHGTGNSEGAVSTHAGNTHYAHKQGVTSLSPTNISADKLQAKLDKWKAGAEEIERKQAAMREKRHTFQPIPTLDTCERCGLKQTAHLGDRRLHR
jgi:hypothetical protein